MPYNMLINFFYFVINYAFMFSAKLRKFFKKINFFWEKFLGAVINFSCLFNQHDTFLMSIF